MNSNPKIFSTGFDLDFWTDAFENIMVSLGDFNVLVEKLVTLGLPSLAVVDGHAYAGGLLMALCHDYRIMRAHKANLCLSEIRIGATLSLVPSTICTEKVGRKVATKLSYGVNV